MITSYASKETQQLDEAHQAVDADYILLSMLTHPLSNTGL